MGYTHYYQVLNWDSDEWKAAWPQLIKDVPMIIDRANGIEISGPTEDEEIVTPVQIDAEKGIYINGVGDDSHEPFIIKKDGWSFCKTARKPYDDIVTTILLRAYMLPPKGFDVSSDGYWDEWSEAQDIYKKLWPGEAPRCPWADKLEQEESDDPAIRVE
ncbi:hypothetical protein N7456_003546 [Penicillium angulare]|uniref:Uncharacterized protein n=1 Tax=Penicillium angulare TaxID=116970 RepID=A0A9W9FUT4_9EURO|nr:hypothetical protein N7456_003546 [Penicillium angulare]